MMEAWVAKEMARRTLALAADFDRYPELASMAAKMRLWAAQIIENSSA